jgi:hypothetical protein
MIHQVQETDTSQQQLFRGYCVKTALRGQIAAKKPLPIIRMGIIFQLKQICISALVGYLEQLLV